MKTFKLIAIGIAFVLASAIQAQISVNVNIGSPPRWAPAGYTDVRWYYLPDVEAYYDVRTSVFIYFDGRSWVRRAYLPDRYRDYDLYHGRKVILKRYHGNAPYNYHEVVRSRYGKGNPGHQGQKPGRGNENRSNQMYDRGYQQDHDQNMNNDRGRGNGKDNGKGKGHGKGN